MEKDYSTKQEEEIMEELREEINETAIETVDENRDDNGDTTEEKSMGGALVVGACLLVGGAVALWHKTSDWRQKRSIEKLRKNGFTVYKSEVVDEDESDSEEDFDEEE
ncbi:hypothetical protein BRYFOR_08568 [Marvinbryantia formatexigens DSM 14469]|uniref:Uncharacterized protein n=2 Tax=Marvinbryantia TaxID=248744 RepID=C6LIT8_9FIRM|nr:hypothetical protein BRYFOR_08568 [Marvinbryantia formatexigens DSM 14469]